MRRLCLKRQKPRPVCYAPQLFKIDQDSLAISEKNCILIETDSLWFDLKTRFRKECEIMTGSYNRWLASTVELNYHLEQIESIERAILQDPHLLREATGKSLKPHFKDIENNKNLINNVDRFPIPFSKKGNFLYNNARRILNLEKVFFFVRLNE